LDSSRTDSVAALSASPVAATASLRCTSLSHSVTVSSKYGRTSSVSLDSIRFSPTLSVSSSSINPFKHGFWTDTSSSSISVSIVRGASTQALFIPLTFSMGTDSQLLVKELFFGSRVHQKYLWRLESWATRAVSTIPPVIFVLATAYLLTG
jgi:hypothetical protein